MQEHTASSLISLETGEQQDQFSLVFFFFLRRQIALVGYKFNSCFCYVKKFEIETSFPVHIRKTR